MLTSPFGPFPATMVLQNPPSLIEYKGKRYLVFDAPADSNVHEYLKVFRQYGVTDVVRVCDPTYNAENLRTVGINVWDWVFADGDAPPPSVVADWLDLVRSSSKKVKDACLGVHCVAGLGRAPVLVAIALIEDGMSAEDAIHFIRKHRRGAINSKQIKFLQKYKPTSYRAAKCCVLM